LLRALAEQLKLPLLHISQHVELARMGHETELKHIETVADMALKLVDSYVLSTQLSQGQLQLRLEPVSVSSVLHDAAEKLEGIAREYACELRLDLSGKYGPVMADRKSLEAAITTLGYSFIEAQAQEGVKKPSLVLAAHRSRHGIVTGVYGDHNELTSDMFRRSKVLSGRARQPLPPLGHTPSAGIFVADSLISAMSSGLKVARHSNLTGLAATLLSNPQMTLI
jgi:hypothetical protein